MLRTDGENLWRSSNIAIAEFAFDSPNANPDRKGGDFSHAPDARLYDPAPRQLRLASRRESSASSVSIPPSQRGEAGPTNGNRMPVDAGVAAARSGKPPLANDENETGRNSASPPASPDTGATGWPEFRALDFEKIKHLVRRPLIVDTKNLLDAVRLREMGFQYVGVGRA